MDGGDASGKISCIYGKKEKQSIDRKTKAFGYRKQTKRRMPAKNVHSRKEVLGRASRGSCMTHTKETLMAFTERIKQAFLAKRIRAPIHLNSEEQAEPLIDLFKDVRPRDWLFSGWRSMWHCLLKGMPEDELFEIILSGRGMYVCSKEHKIICSSIVGGILPTALGVAMGIKRRGGDERVLCCVGDMTATTGLYHEFLSYVRGHALPVDIIIEDNGLSTNADTAATWGSLFTTNRPVRYSYKRTTPHVGCGLNVTF